MPRVIEPSRRPAYPASADAREPPPKHEHTTFRFERWWERRIERKGLRPRDAAYLVAGFWAIAAVSFGVIERIVDPKTFHTVWLGIWWAIETVTTVGYGDIVPSQPIGKVIGAFLMLGGLSLLAIVTAAITSAFVARAQARRKLAGARPGDGEARSARDPAAERQERARATARGWAKEQLVVASPAL